MKRWLERLLGRGERPQHVARLTRAQLEAADDPDWAIVNAVYDMLASTRYEELTRRQRFAQLALFYDNEINNGGHLQYFHNDRMEHAEDLPAALKAIGAHGQHKIYARALAYAREHPVEQAESLEDYSDRAHEYEFWDEDEDHYACRPEIGNVLLPAYILKHLDEFAALDEGS